MKREGVRKGCGLLVAAMVVVPWSLAVADDALAPLVEEEAKEGTREEQPTFTYRKTVDQRSESKGGRLNAGADKVHERTTVRASGRATVVVPDRDYLELKMLRVDGPGGKVREFPMPEMLMIGWMSNEPPQEIGGKSISRQVMVRGHRLHEHFTMNVWGPEDPRWYRETKDTDGNERWSWSAGKAPAKEATDMLSFSLSSTDPENTFSFGYGGGCDTTVEEWEYPPERRYEDGTPDPYWTLYRKWPTDYCRGKDAVERTNCFLHLQVTDRRDK